MLEQFDQNLLVFAFMATWAGFAIYAEQKWKWAEKISALGISIIGALLLVNFNVLPETSAAYDLVYAYVLPLAIPILLFRSDLRKIYRESGKTFLIFHISCFASLVGGIVAGIIFRGQENVAGLVAMEVGAGTGGSINQIAMAETFGIDSAFINAAVIAGNLLVLIYLLIVNTIPNLPFFRKHYKHPYIDEAEGGKTDITELNKKGGFNVIDFSKTMGAAFVILGVSTVISQLVSTANVPQLVQQVGGNIYLVLTFVTVALVTCFPKFFEKINGAEAIGTYMLMLFFVTLGTGAKIIDVIKIAPMIFAFEGIMMLINIALSLIIGKIMKLNLEQLLICSNASYGGPTTAVAMVVSKGWGKLAVPAMLVGLYGYIIGNYLGLFAGNLFGGF